MLLGLRTVIYKVPDLDKAKKFYSKLLGVEPYFDQPFYVGFNVGGFELGLDPDSAKWSAGRGGTVGYWGVNDLAATLKKLSADKVEIAVPLQEVGEGIKVAVIKDPFGNDIGLIENPHFKS